MLKVRFLKQLDRILGNAAVFFMRKPTPVAVQTPHKILFIRPGGIGDAVFLLRAIRAVKDTYPSCSITVLAEKRNASIFLFNDAVTRILLYDRMHDLLAAIRGGFDVVIDTEQWHRLSAVIARLTGAPLLVGFGTNNRKKLFTHPIPYFQDRHESESFQTLLEPLGISSVELLESLLEIPPQVVAAVEKKLAVLAGKPYIVLFPGASISERRWGTVKFRELARRIHAMGFPVVVVGGRDDALSGNDIISSDADLNFAGKTSLAESAAIIARSRLLVTGDSGLLHIAAELKVPTVSLFGPGIEKKWAPRDDRHIVLNKHLSCSPCTSFGYTPKCRIGARCLALITVEDVERAIRLILG
ncbi:MAG: glycosyltransferase family 9 protein [Geobacteraceae bacterium]|nr:glycosyltransferase family 9 protein [Geobacteraceae bacterium]